MPSNKTAFKDYKIGDTVRIVENDYPTSCGDIGKVAALNSGGVEVLTPQLKDSLFHFYYQVQPMDLSTLERLIWNIK